MIHLKQSHIYKDAAQDDPHLPSIGEHNIPLWMFERFTVCVEVCSLTGGLRPYIRLSMEDAISLTDTKFIQASRAGNMCCRKISTERRENTCGRKPDRPTFEFVPTEISNPLASPSTGKQLGQVRVTIQGHLVGKMRTDYPSICLVAIARWTNISEIEKYDEKNRLDALLTCDSSSEDCDPCSDMYPPTNGVQSKTDGQSLKNGRSSCLLPSALPCIQVGFVYRVDGLIQQNGKTFLMDRRTSFIELAGHQLPREFSCADTDHNIAKILSTATSLQKSLEISALKCLIIGPRSTSPRLQRHQYLLVFLLRRRHSRSSLVWARLQPGCFFPCVT